jgi:HSP20 family protein
VTSGTVLRGQMASSGEQFRLPGNADLDHVKAHLEDGVLRITVPKLAEEKRRQPKVINIASEEGSSGEDIKASKA